MNAGMVSSPQGVFPSVTAIARILRTVMDPELGISLVDLGVIYGIFVEEPDVRVLMTFTTPGCPLHEVLLEGVRQAVLAQPGVRYCQIELAAEPPWNPTMISEAGRSLLGGPSDPLA